VLARALVCGAVVAHGQEHVIALER
jgi:hypothetical protein